MWYALLATSGRERKSLAYLVKRGYLAYWPHYYARTRWRGHKSREIVRAALPGYMFLPSDKPDWPLILEAPGIRDVMRDGDSPYQLSDIDMKKIRLIDEAVNASPVSAARGIPFKVGQRVRLIHSLWEGWETEILGIDKSGQITLEVPLLGGHHKAKIALAEIEAV